MGTVARVRGLALLVALVAAGCDEPSSGGGDGGKVDAGGDGGFVEDGGPDASLEDAQVDAYSGDAGEDASEDATPVDEDTGTGSGQRGTTADAAADADADADVDAAEPDATTEPDATVETGFPTLEDYIACNSDDDCPNSIDWQCVTQLSLHHADLDGANVLPIANLDPTLDGVCSRDCSRDRTACDDLNLDPVEGSAPFECQVVWVGESPYPDDLSFPFDAQLDEEAMAAGPAFAALCRPPLGLDPDRSPRFCEACSDQNDCDADSVCWDALSGDVDPGDGTGRCVEVCQADLDCPLGFSCRDVGSAGAHCVPVADTCGDCQDRDRDGRGAGFCAHEATDCDDGVAAAYYDATDMNHPFPAHCGDVDYNCNGVQDSSELIEDYDTWGAYHCGACGATCAGYVDHGTRRCGFDANDGQIACRATCTDPLAYADCDGDPDTGCEIEIEGSDRIYYVDADGDGYGDEDYPTFACTAGEAPTGTVQNASDCDDTPDTGASIYPGAPERCNLIDDDCDTSVDEGLPTTPHYVDADGDGQGEKGSAFVLECPWQGGGVDPRGLSFNAFDCDDAEPTTRVGADEHCDGDTLAAQVDSDCDGDLHDAPDAEKIVLYGDTDGDGRWGGSTERFCADVEGDDFFPVASLYCDDGAKYAECETLAADCGGNNPNKWVGAPELCDGINNDCDGSTVDGSDVTVGDGTASSVVFGSSCAGLGLSGAAGACDVGATWQCGEGPNLTCTAAPPATDEAWQDDTGSNDDENCDGYPGDDDRNAYVDIDLGVNSTSAGTASKPYQTISYALARFRNGGSEVAGKDTIVIAHGSYVHSAALELVEGVNLVGGFLHSSGDHSWTKGGTVVLERNWVADDGHVTGVTGRDLSTRTVIADLTIEVASASASPGEGESGVDSRGVFLENAPGVALRNVHVRLGNGANGGGAADASGTVRAGAEGKIPFGGSSECAFYYRDDGGTLRHTQVNTGGGSGSQAGAGFAGLALHDGLVGAGGSGPGNPDGASAARHTQAILAAYNASRGGAFSKASGLSSEGLWSYAETIPTDGMPGGGGGGGISADKDNPSFWGGGGGGGGCGGGSGANAGHGSNLLGVLIVDSDGAELSGVTVETGMAGHGGDGGKGSRGGNGGAGAAGLHPAGDGGDGSGGSGGGGGAGGHGGHNMGVLVFGDDVCDGVGDVSCSGGLDKNGQPTDSCVGSGGSAGAGGGRGSGGSGTAYTSGVNGTAGKTGRRELCLALPDCIGGCPSNSTCGAIAGAGSYCIPTR